MTLLYQLTCCSQQGEHFHRLYNEGDCLLKVVNYAHPSNDSHYLTQAQTFHYHALPCETCVAVQLYAHNLVPGEAVVGVWDSLEQRELLRTGFTECYWVDSFKMRWIREKGNFD